MNCKNRQRNIKKILILLQKYYKIIFRVEGKGGRKLLKGKLCRAMAWTMLGVAVWNTTLPAGMLATNTVAAATNDLMLKNISIEGSEKKVQGTRITLTAQCQGGAGEYSYSYRVLLPSGKVETIAEETVKDTIEYTLSEVGTYNFMVRVTDGYDVVTDTVECQAERSKVLLNYVKLNKTSFKKKDTVKFSIKATPATGKVSSKVLLTIPGGKKVLVKGYSTKMTASYKLKKKGTYKATISVKDSKTSTSKTLRFQVR